jgi:hypothetical protein
MAQRPTMDSYLPTGIPDYNSAIAKHSPCAHLPTTAIKSNLANIFDRRDLLNANFSRA